MEPASPESINQRIWSDAVSIARQGGIGLPEFAKIAKKVYIERLLIEFNGNRCQAAKALGIHRNTLTRDIEELAINVQSLMDRDRRQRFKMPRRPRIRVKSAHEVEINGLSLAKAH